MNGDDIRTLADLPARIQKRLLAGEDEPVFQLLPALEERDQKALRESVAERGIRIPVELDSEGRVLDGHYRLEVAAELELEAGEIPVTVRDDIQAEEDVLEYVLEVNLGRRHLTPAGRREIARELRSRGWSLRQIADRVGVGKSTVARDLKGVPSGTPVDGPDPPESVKGADGKRYPATRGPSRSGGDGSGGRRRPPGHAQGRGGKSPPGSRNRSGGRRRRKADRSASAENESEPDRDPRIDLLNQADRLLSKARRMTPKEETDIRNELEVLGDRCADLVAEIAGAGDGWVV